VLEHRQRLDADSGNDDPTVIPIHRCDLDEAIAALTTLRNSGRTASTRSAGA
jgi:hypothetical protein